MKRRRDRYHVRGAIAAVVSHWRRSAHGHRSLTLRASSALQVPSRLGVVILHIRLRGRDIRSQLRAEDLCHRSLEQSRPGFGWLLEEAILDGHGWLRRSIGTCTCGLQVTDRRISLRLVDALR